MPDRAEVKVLSPLVLLPVLGLQAILWDIAPLRLLPEHAAGPLGLVLVAISVALAISPPERLFVPGQRSTRARPPPRWWTRASSGLRATRSTSQWSCS
jgi:hypothetical protein